MAKRWRVQGEYGDGSVDYEEDENGHWVRASDHEREVSALRAKLSEVEAERGCQCEACQRDGPHMSDCSVHNGPALPDGACTCGLASAERCRRCGRRYLAVWAAPDREWSQVMPTNAGLFCPMCFDVLYYEATGKRLYWACEEGRFPDPDGYRKVLYEVEAVLSRQVELATRTDTELVMANMKLVEARAELRTSERTRQDEARSHAADTRRAVERIHKVEAERDEALAELDRLRAREAARPCEDHDGIGRGVIRGDCGTCPPCKARASKEGV